MAFGPHNLLISVTRGDQLGLRTSCPHLKEEAGHFPKMHSLLHDRLVMKAYLESSSVQPTGIFDRTNVC